MGSLPHATALTTRPTLKTPGWRFHTNPGAVGCYASWPTKLDVYLPPIGSQRPPTHLVRQVETIKVHYLGPGGYEIIEELRASVGAGVDFGQRAKL